MAKKLRNDIEIPMAQGLGSIELTALNPKEPETLNLCLHLDIMIFHALASFPDVLHRLGCMISPFSEATYQDPACTLRSGYRVP